MAYDPIRQEILMVGGIDSDHDPLRDLWVYARHPLGGYWWRRGPDLEGYPPHTGHTEGSDWGLFGHAMTYDAEEQQVMVAGGTVDSLFTTLCAPDYARSIELFWVDAFGWRRGGSLRYAFAHGQSRFTGPTGAGLAADPFRKKVLMLGGQWYHQFSPDLQDPCGTGSFINNFVSDNLTTLEVLGHKLDRTRKQRPAGGSSAGGRQQHMMCFDEGRNRVVVFGGINGQENLALPVHMEWRPALGSDHQYEVIPPGELPGGAPPGRSRGAMVYNAARKSVVLFGGTTAETEDWPETLLDLLPGGDDGEVLGDTWELVRSDLEILSFPQNQTRNACEAAEFQAGVAPQVGTILSYQWMKEGVMLQDDGRLTGARSDTLRFTRLRYEDEGAYELLITDEGCGEAEVYHLGPFQLKIEPLPPWLNVTTGGPDNRTGAGMVYDVKRGVCVLFGGEAYGFPTNGATSQQRYLANDTWEWNGTVWRRRQSTLAPPARQNMVMVYDAKRGETVLFGGIAFDPRGLTNIYYGDTWTWNGSDWMLRSIRGPSPRARGTAAFHEGVGKLLMYGGDIATAPFYADELWSWDGADWFPETGTDVDYNGTNWVEKPSMPLACYPYTQMVYDPNEEQCILFGPFYDRSAPGLRNYNTVLSWDGVSWSSIPEPLLEYAPELGSVSYPDTRGQFAYYDPTRREVAIFGTRSGTAGIVTFKGRRFGKRASTPSNFNMPPGNVAAYDSRRRALVTFGSVEPFYTGPGITREIRFLDEPTVVREPVEQRVAVGRPASFETLVGGVPPLDLQWFKDGVPINDGLGLTGTRSERLSVLAVGLANYGDYRLRVRNACGETFSQRVVLAPPGENGTLTVSWGGLDGREAILTWDQPGARLERSFDLRTWKELEGATSPHPASQDQAMRTFFRLKRPE